MQMIHLDRINPQTSMGFPANSRIKSAAARERCDRVMGSTVSYTYTAGENAMRPRVLVVHTIDDLDSLLRASRTGWRMPQSQLTLAIPELNEEERLSVQRKLNAYSNTCGCAEGGAFALTALAITIAYSVFRLLHGNWIDFFKVWPAGVGLILLCAGLGKLTGIGVARVRLSRQIRSVENLIAVATREKEDEK